MVEQRPLEPSESLLMRSDQGIVFDALVEGPVDVDAMERAWAELLALDPALAGTISQQQGRYVLSARAPARSKARTATTTPEHREALAAALDPATALARLVVTPCEGGYRVGLAIHHAVADGRAAAALYALLWERYTAVLSGKGEHVAPRGGLRPGAEPFLSHLFTREEVEAAVRAYRGAFHGFPKGPAAGVGDDGAVRVRRLLLDRAETNSLLATARRAEVSVHALLCAALLSAGRRADADEGAPLLLSGWSVVDLRRRVTPHVSDLGVTNFTSGAKSELDVARDTDPLQLARRVKRQLDSQLAARTPQKLALRLGEVVGAAFASVSPPRFLLTNLGVLPPLQVPDGVAIRDLRFYDSQPVPVPIYMAQTYAGRLSVELVQWQSAASEEQARTALGTLREALVPSSPPVPL
ncbi:phthiocerol/phthiodiolone dimycocerosyl transferase family protein [Streptomyces sulphureus]|uniref:phthiocerol/phthiodiolone dimycocerosyl transferase family protein n=1 Tax=Streptomyces sulphureus TaxID=47758 RepID=UPI00037DBF47|nr:hypothetical protein [Streptomyces sulphureus]